MSARSVFLGGIILEAVLVVLAVLGSYLYDGKFLLNPILFDLDGLGTGIAASLPMVAYFVFSLSPFGRNLAPFKRIYVLLRKILSSALIDMRAWQITALGMSAGIGEEFLFRGFLQPLAENWTSPLGAILVTGFIFGLLHALTPTYFILATAMSIYFGFLVEQTDNLVTPILAHGLYDVIGFLLLKRLFLKDRLATATATPEIHTRAKSGDDEDGGNEAEEEPPGGAEEEPREN